MAVGVAIIGGGIFAREEHKASQNQTKICCRVDEAPLARRRSVKGFGAKGSLLKITEVGQVARDGRD